MTESELLSIAQEAWSNNLALTAIYLSVVTGYLVVAYSAGKKLTSNQMIIVSSLLLSRFFNSSNVWLFSVRN